MMSMKIKPKLRYITSDNLHLKFIINKEFCSTDNKDKNKPLTLLKCCMTFDIMKIQIRIWLHSYTLKNNKESH